jgi:hypothetical protein
MGQTGAILMLVVLFRKYQLVCSYRREGGKVTETTDIVHYSGCRLHQRG